MRSVIDQVNAWAALDAVASWLNAEPDRRVALYRNEDLVVDTPSSVAELCSDLDIEMPAEKGGALVQRFAFEHFLERPGLDSAPTTTG